MCVNVVVVSTGRGISDAGTYAHTHTHTTDTHTHTHHRQTHTRAHTHTHTTDTHTKTPVQVNVVVVRTGAWDLFHLKAVAAPEPDTRQAKAAREVLRILIGLARGL